jgi:cell division septum initiation protein DivIVA
MGWGRWLLLGDLGQQMELSDHGAQIEDQEERIRRLKKQLAEKASAIDNAEASLIQLQVENDQLKLYLAAVVRILIEKGLTSAKEIKRLVEVIDVEDGTADGRLKGDIVTGD